MSVLATIMNLGGPDLLIILLLVLVLFGAKKLPELARGMGQAVKEFQKAKDEFSDELHKAGKTDEPRCVRRKPTFRELKPRRRHSAGHDPGRIQIRTRRPASVAGPSALEARESSAKRQLTWFRSCENIGVLPMSAPDLRAQIKEMMVKNLMLQMTANQIADDAPLFGPNGIGLDSIDALELAVGLEKNFGVSVPNAEIAAQVLRSVNSIHDYILEKRGEAAQSSTS